MQKREKQQAIYIEYTQGLVTELKCQRCIAFSGKQEKKNRRKASPSNASAASSLVH
jgi:hypothetical protein